MGLSMGFSRQEYWSGLPCSPPWDLPDPGIEPTSLKSPVLAGGFFTTSATWEAGVPSSLEHHENHCRTSSATPSSLRVLEVGVSPERVNSPSIELTIWDWLQRPHRGKQLAKQLEPERQENKIWEMDPREQLRLKQSGGGTAPVSGEPSLPLQIQLEACFCENEDPPFARTENKMKTLVYGESTSGFQAVYFNSISFKRSVVTYCSPWFGKSLFHKFPLVMNKKSLSRKIWKKNSSRDRKMFQSRSCVSFSGVVCGVGKEVALRDRGSW